MLENLKDYNIILASGSPRRKELLAGLGINFETKVLKGIDESYPNNIPAKEVAEYISKQKAAAYKNILNDKDMIITADTVVINGKEILGKPHNKQQASEMLENLSNKTHSVVTGVTILTKEKSISFSTETKVDFAKLSGEEINYYIDNYKPFDKAGAYGIQEWIGYVAVKSISGSYFNVMGLPIQRLYQELKNW